MGNGAAITRRSIRVVAAAALVTLVWAPTGFAQPRANPTATAIADYSKRITAYLELTKHATEGLSPLEKTDDPVEIASREIALGEAIRAGRAGAQPGNILAPDVARVFRQIIKANVRQRPRQAQKVMFDEIPHFHPKVNQTYPSAWPLATFPATLLAELPALPDELEYRLLSEALILRDVKANIIIDFILDVF